MLAQSSCRSLFVAFFASVAMLSWSEAVFAQAVPPAATVADKFTLVHNSLLQRTLEYFKNIMAATGFLLLAIGWLLTSKEARSFLAEHRRARNLMLVAIWTVAALDLASQAEALRISDARLRLLERLAYIDRVYFEDHGVSWVVMVWTLPLVNTASVGS